MEGRVNQTGVSSPIGNITLEAGAGTTWCGGINTGAVNAQGSVSLHGSGRWTIGSIYSNSNVTVNNTVGSSAFSGYLRQNGGVQARGNIWWESGASPFALSDNYWISNGLWGNNITVKRDDWVDVSDTDLNSIGKIPNCGNEAIRAYGNVGLYPCYDIVGWRPDIKVDGDIRHRGDYTEDEPWWGGDVEKGSEYQNSATPLPSEITVSAPGVPGAPTVQKGGDIDVLYQASPQQWGLSQPVQMLQPSWGHFRDKANQDDRISSNPSHILLDDGRPEHGDYDGRSGNGQILFRWVSGPGGNSSNETVYNDDPNVDVVVDVVNFGATSNFTGTIVSRGSVYLQKSVTDWFIEQGQTLNIAAGMDIKCITSGFTLWKKDNNHFHFYARRNIDLSNATFNLGSSLKFYGSFTAGNEVIFKDNGVFTDAQFRWSRWALDPVGWVPPYQTLSWREI